MKLVSGDACRNDTTCATVCDSTGCRVLTRGSCDDMHVTGDAASAAKTKKQVDEDVHDQQLAGTCA